MTDPIKSAFAPIRATAASGRSSSPSDSDAISIEARSTTSIVQSSKSIAQSSCAPSEETDQPPASQIREEPIEIVPVHLQFRAIDNSEKSGIGFCFLSERPSPKVRSIVGVLNRSNPLTERALRSGDAQLVSFLWGCLVAELLIYRRNKNPAIAAVHAYLAEKLGLTHNFVTVIATALSSRLSAPFRNADGIYGPSAARETGCVSIAQLAVPMPRSIASQQWGRSPDHTKTSGINTAATSENRGSGQRGALVSRQTARKAAE